MKDRPATLGYTALVLLVVGGLVLFLALLGSIHEVTDELRKSREINLAQESRIIQVIRDTEHRIMTLQAKVGIDPLERPRRPVEPSDGDKR